MSQREEAWGDKGRDGVWVQRRDGVSMGEEGWVHIGFVWYKKNIEQGGHIPTI